VGVVELVEVPVPPGEVVVEALEQVVVVPEPPQVVVAAALEGEEVVPRRNV
jgi:hypothetical protein